ncbi:hypothetical protein C8R41DRAFT_867129 [Lentinula lateritia]|uniref:Uncharacterized protein n=1 Tax=Lentinula lateritia TaxID=40482 RepID=A0ABQ8VIP3_9AGAR|nr:hypothetical protein C8R41DRAFT_867129 [Lentinula lateritia]
MAELDKWQLVFDEMNKDPNAKRGPKTEWSGDGHDKLTGIGFPIWAVRDVWSGKWLGIWLVPNNRLKDTIAYLYLKLVYEYGDMDAQPHFTRAQARAARPEDDDPATRQVTSLHQSILGPPPVLMDGDPASGGPVTNLPATPPPTFVQPAWILPRPHGEDTVRAREAIRASRSHTQFSNPADSPSQLNIPVDPPSRASPAAFGSPMAQDPANLDDDDKWFGVDASDLYKLYNVYATSGKEGSGHHTYSRPRSAFSSPGDDNVHCVPPPVELSPSVVLEDFVELPPHTASSVPASRHLHAPSRGPFRDPASAPVPNFLQNGRGQQPAPTIHVHSCPPAAQRGHAYGPTRGSHPRARTCEPSPGPDFGAHLRRSSCSLSLVSHYAPARFDSSSLRLSRLCDCSHINPYNMHSSDYARSRQDMEHRVPVKNGCRFRDPHQGEISSSVPAAMLNQVNPLVISALRSGWPTFISLNYFSCRMSEMGESSVSAAGETWDVDEASQVKFKTKWLKELSFESISQRDWDSIAKNMPRALKDYFIPPGECGIHSELASLLRHALGSA